MIEYSQLAQFFTINGGSVRYAFDYGQTYQKTINNIKSTIQYLINNQENYILNLKINGKAVHAVVFLGTKKYQKVSIKLIFMMLMNQAK